MGAERWEGGRNLEESAREYTFGPGPDGGLAFSRGGTPCRKDSICTQRKSYIQEHLVLRQQLKRVW